MLCVHLTNSYCVFFHLVKVIFTTDLIYLLSNISVKKLAFSVFDNCLNPILFAVSNS